MEVDQRPVDALLLDRLGQERGDQPEKIVGLVLGEGRDQVVSGEGEVRGLRREEEGEVRVFPSDEGQMDELDRKSIV